MSLINDNFMLTSKAGQTLYRCYAKNQPIIDYHCHLEAKDIFENKPFRDITQLWLAGDHYKWRAMRANGIHEKYITGTESAEEKFAAWAKTVESSFGNPLYHWTHLELEAYFGIHQTLSHKNWREVMDECNEKIASDDFLPRALITRSRVEVICTTDKPLDDLKYHQLLQQEEGFKTKVLPTFRPDELFEADPTRFSQFVSQLAQATEIPVRNLASFIAAISLRIDYFHDAGCRISDHGPVEIVYRPLTDEQANALFVARLERELTHTEMQAWNSVILIKLAALYKQKAWAMQIHFGALRNNNVRQYHAIGINSGFDSIADQENLAASLNALLNTMAENNGLPKTIIYNLNASYNDIVASALANFQNGDDGIKSPMQLGSGWWFNDTHRGMVNQLITLADQGLLSNFIGMLTDSRSFVSYTRHDYFRRILCNLIGSWVDRGELPEDMDILSSMIKGICVNNARSYFNF
ncbi:glucuronate isomerase [Phytobacter sp. V91]|uniref:glucuronate isomerase n=1 Tax=Phytobacter sp. V91 TaxID=3369425 RepID=UPI003F5E3355